MTPFAHRHTASQGERICFDEKLNALPFRAWGFTSPLINTTKEDRNTRELIFARNQAIKSQSDFIKRPAPILGGTQKEKEILESSSYKKAEIL